MHYVSYDDAKYRAEAHLRVCVANVFLKRRLSEHVYIICRQLPILRV